MSIARCSVNATDSCVAYTSGRTVWGACMDEEQRRNIIELLFPEYWMPEAKDILNDALLQGFTLDEIAYVATRFGIEIVIINTYVRSIGSIEGWALTGPDTPAPIPLISFSPIGFTPS